MHLSAQRPQKRERGGVINKVNYEHHVSIGKPRERSSSAYTTAHYVHIFLVLLLFFPALYLSFPLVKAVTIHTEWWCVSLRGPFIDLFWLTGVQFVKEPLGASLLTSYNKNRLLSLHIYPKNLQTAPSKCWTLEHKEKNGWQAICFSFFFQWSQPYPVWSAPELITWPQSTMLNHWLMVSQRPLYIQCYRGSSTYTGPRWTYTAMGTFTHTLHSPYLVINRK